MIDWRLLFYKVQMVFSSITFLFYFLPLFLAVYFCTNKPSIKITAIFFFSLLFYAWGEPVYVFLMLVSIIVNWFLALLIDRDIAARKCFLYLAVIFNLSVLFFFKYSPFIVGNMKSFLGYVVPNYDYFRKLPLPVGISFFTFQALSYVIDVYRSKYKSEKNIIILGTYISMFPQLIAGPIVRYEHIRQDLHDISIKFENVISGTQLFILGLAAKVLLANNFAVAADYYFSKDSNYLSFIASWIGALSYYFQIYFDFNGYSIMAIGLGRIMGFNFQRNFDRPYIAHSISDFWHRWHISLSTWFRDYLYIPLGGSRVSNFVTYRNLLVVFILCGLWHGAGWNFLLWGLFHGFFLIFERLFFVNKFVFPTILKRSYVFIVVIIGWVLFRCNSFEQLKGYLFAMIGLCDIPAHTFREVNYSAWGCMSAIGAFLSVVRLDYDKPPFSRHITGIIIYLSLFLLSVAFLLCGTYNPFIYYRF